MKTRTEDIDVGAKRWEYEIEPVIETAKSTRGFVAELVRELNSITAPRVWQRQQIDRYLHPDPDRRIEPLAGIGIVLLEAARKVSRKMKAEKDREAAAAARKEK